MLAMVVAFMAVPIFSFETADCYLLSEFGLLDEGDLIEEALSEGPRGTAVGTLPVICRFCFVMRLIF